jgi:hypothetical protein
MTDTRRKNRLIILAVAGLFFLPVIASVVLNSRLVDFHPMPQTNRGELVQPPIAIEPAEVVAADGQSLDLTRLDGMWTVVMLAENGCDQACQEELQGLLRTDVALNVRADQVDYVVLDLGSQLATGKIPVFQRDDVTAAYAAANPALLAAIEEAAGSITVGHEFILNDGYLMMRYDERHGGPDVLKDLQRLTRAKGRDDGED